MWIYTKKGFLSIVQDRDNPDLLIVRARIKGDIEALFPFDSLAVEDSTGTDYRFRVKLPKKKVAYAMATHVADIDYPNFKAEISADGDYRGQFYTEVWAIMSDLQQLHPKNEDKESGIAPL